MQTPSVRSAASDSLWMRHFSGLDFVRNWSILKKTLTTLMRSQICLKQKRYLIRITATRTLLFYLFPYFAQFLEPNWCLDKSTEFYLDIRQIQLNIELYQKQMICWLVQTRTNYPHVVVVFWISIIMIHEQRNTITSTLLFSIFQHLICRKQIVSLQLAIDQTDCLVLIAISTFGLVSTQSLTAGIVSIFNFVRMSCTADKNEKAIHNYWFVLLSLPDTLE